MKQDEEEELGGTKAFVTILLYGSVFLWQNLTNVVINLYFIDSSPCQLLIIIVFLNIFCLKLVIYKVRSLCLNIFKQYVVFIT